MSRTLYAEAPVTSELAMRLRRIEGRIGAIETALRERAVPAGVPPDAPVPDQPVPVVDAPPADRRWAEIGSRLEALALKLKLHYEQAGGGGVPRPLDEVHDRVDDVVTATGNAIHDEAVRADVREVGVMMADAMADALSTVGGDIREAVGRADTRKGGSP